MNKSDVISNLAKALSIAQSEIRGAQKNADNPFFKSSYADLGSVWDSIREPLTKNGLSVIQLPCMIGDKPGLETTLAHSSGEWISNSIVMNPVKNDPQGMGSAISYYRRYALASVIGVYQTDDDGNHASQPFSNVESKPKTPAPIRKDSDQWIVPFGKFKGKDLKSIPIDDLLGYRDYILVKSREDNKPLSGSVKEFVDRVDSMDRTPSNESGSQYDAFIGDHPL